MKLLLIRCSKRKRNVQNVRAIDLYDGINYHILRQYYPIENVDVRIISAKYGLISPDKIISNYDVTIKDLSGKEKEDLSLRVTEDLRRLLSYSDYSEIFLDLGKDYLDLIKLDLSSYDGIPREKRNIVRDPRGIGYKAQTLKRWLSNNSSNLMRDFEFEE